MTLEQLREQAVTLLERLEGEEKEGSVSDPHGDQHPWQSERPKDARVTHASVLRGKGAAVAPSEELAGGLGPREPQRM